MLSMFALDIQVSLKAEPVFNFGPLHVTTSMIYGAISALIIAVIMIGAAWRIKLMPRRGPSAIIEALVSYLIDTMVGVFGSYEQAVRFVPVFGFYFIFILFNNLLELLPFVGPGVYTNHGGVHEALLRPFTADLNGTVAMAIIAILTVQYLSIREQGAKKHFLHYFDNKPGNPIHFFIGLLELFSELTRILSLSLRLFLNTAVGEILILVFTSIVVSSGRTPIVVVPILMFEALVAYIQAYVFMLLSSTYLGLAIGHKETHHDNPHVDDPKNQESKPGLASN